MPTLNWGNARAKTFEKEHVRPVRIGDVQVPMNRVLVRLTTDLLIDVQQTGVDVSSIRSDGPSRRGVKLDAPESLQDTLAEIGARHGFTFYAPDTFRFEESAEWAGQESKRRQDADAAAVEEQVAAVVEEQMQVEPVPGGKLGCREIGPGDTGEDVRVLQAFLGVEATGDFGPGTEDTLRGVQSAAGLPVTGAFDAETWNLLVPVHRRWRRIGDVGRDVRLVQAGLYARGLLDRPPSARFDHATGNALRALSGRPGLPKIDSLVWEGLFDIHSLIERPRL